MRILLINPYYPIDETPSPPLGLSFIAAALEAANHEVFLLDFVVYPYSFEILNAKLNEISPDIVGVTSVTMSFDNAISVVSAVKKSHPAVLTVMGGPHVTFHAPQTLTQFPELDCIVMGEGDETVVAWAKAVENGTDWETVEGLAYRRDGDVVVTPTRKPADINTLPIPARHQVPLGRYRALGMAISMTSSRGCPFKCIFCVGRKMVGAKVRYRNPAAVVDEMAHLWALGFHQINMADDLFTANKAHCHAVCDEILSRHLAISWTSFARVDTVSEDVLIKMKSAGCHTVSFGVETGNPEMLKRIRKGITLGQVEKAIAMCNRAGITPHVSFIIGLPNETPGTLQDSIDFGDKLSRMGAQHGFHILAPFPGTEVREQPEKYDLHILTDDWSQYHANRAIVETSTVSRRMLDDVVLAWEKKYKDYLGNLKKLRDTGEGTPEQIWPLTRLEYTVHLYDLMMAQTIEKLGWYSSSVSRPIQDAHVDSLVRRLEKSSNIAADALKSAITFAIDQGYLTCETESNRIRWQWMNYL